MIDALDGHPRSWPPRWREAWEERAAIAEYHGGMDKRTAEERAAWWIVRQLRSRGSA